MGTALITNLVASHVKEEHPTTNYNTSTKLPVRDFTNTDVNSYLYWARPFPLKAQIISAKLVFYTTAETTPVGTRGFKFTRLAVGFSDSKLNYNNRPVTFITGDKTISKTIPWADKTMWELDITDWMQSVANGGPWFGLRVVPTVAENEVLWMYSELWTDPALRPRIEVSWADAPNTPQGLSPAGGRSVSVQKPVVRGQFIDVSGDTTLNAVRVQIDAGNDFTISPDFDSGWVLSSVPELDLSRTDMPGGVWGGLSDGQTTYWRIAFKDGAGVESPWSASTSFSRDNKGSLVVNNPPVGTPIYGIMTQDTWSAAILASVLPAVGGTPPVWQATNQNTEGEGFGTVSTCAYPGTVSANDVLIWQQYIEPEGITVSAPDGTWFKFAEVDQPGDGSSDFRMQLWYKRAAGGETGNVIFTHANNVRRASLTRISGAVTTGSPLEEIVTQISATSSTATPVLAINAATDRLMFWAGASEVNTSQAWTPPTGYTERLDAGSTALATKANGSTASPVIEDATPPIAWTFSGETQSAYQIQIYHTVNSVRYIDWDTGKITSTITSLTVPVGAVNEPTGTTYTVVVRIWDTKAREATPGDPTYVEVTRNFTFVPGATTGSTSLTAVPDASGKPKVVLTWQSATFPDRFNITRNGKIIAAALDPNDTFVSGTTHTYTDLTPSPRRELDYAVQRVVNNVASASNSTVNNVVVNSLGIWLQEPISGIDVCIEGRDDRPFILNEQGTVLQSIAPNSVPVAINQSLGGLEGTISGQLISWMGLTAQQWRDNYIKLRNMRVKQFYLTTGDYTFPVVCQEFTYEQRTIPELVYRVSFKFYQQEAINSILL